MEQEQSQSSPGTVQYASLVESSWIVPLLEPQISHGTVLLASLVESSRRTPAYGDGSTTTSVVCRHEARKDFVAHNWNDHHTVEEQSLEHIPLSSARAQSTEHCCPPIRTLPGASCFFFISFFFRVFLHFPSFFCPAISPTSVSSFLCLSTTCLLIHSSLFVPSLPKTWMTFVFDTRFQQCLNPFLWLLLFVFCFS